MTYRQNDFVLFSRYHGGLSRVVILFGLIFVTISPFLGAAEKAPTKKAGKKSETQSTVVYRQDFDDEIPGRSPKDWRRFWGNVGDDTFLITSEKAGSDDNSLVFSHFSVSPMHGVGVPFKQTVADGTLTVSYKILLSTGSELGFEIREESSRVSVARWSFGKSTFTPSSCKPGAKRSPTGITTRPDQWYTLTVVLPVGKNAGETITYSLTDADGKTSVAECEYYRTGSPLRFLFVNLPPVGAPDAQTWLDDLSITLTD